MVEGNPHKFLSTIWGKRQGYVFLPFKDLNKVWHNQDGKAAIPYDGRETPLPDIEGFKGDIYFCPLVFSEKQRKKEYALPTNLLWADLDPVHPDKCAIRPSIAWESSPGRYQALWILNREIPAEEAAQLSKRIAYRDGADRGGWDVTQVLRIPGSRNFKYDMAPPVRLLWADRHAYSTKEIKKSYPRLNGHDTSAPTGNWPDVREQAIQSAIASIPHGIRRRITRDPSGADRSRELQLLARDVLRLGIDPDVLAHILQRSTLNKFAGRPSEHEDLLKQVADAQVAVESTKPKKRKTPRRSVAEAPDEETFTEMQVHQWGSFMSIPTKLEWLIDDAWVDRSVGFISGRSKSYKTWIALDLALSIVSGQPFLGKYNVRRSGPVLLVQEEDPAPVLQERLRLIGLQKGMMPTVEILDGDVLHLEFPEYPLYIINLQGFNLGDDEKIDQVRRKIAEINPVAVILDPLIVMLSGTGADENKASDLAPILQAVKMWREEFGCSVVIVHHWKKGKPEEGDRFAQSMYGSFVFHAWLESALHVMPVIEDDQEKIDTVVVEREFKAAPSGRNMRLKFHIDSTGEYIYEVLHEDDKNLSPMGQQLLDLIQEAGEQGLSTPELVNVTGHQRPKVVEQLKKMVRNKQVVVLEKGGGRGKSTRYGARD